jgi:hypothetical protein
MAGDEDILQTRIARWIRDNWEQLVLHGGTAGVAVTAVCLSVNRITDVLYSYMGGAFCLFLLFQITGSIKIATKQTKLSVLEQDVRRLKEEKRLLEDRLQQTAQDYFELIRNRLASFANESLQLTADERISLYSHDGRAFILDGRYSRNRSYDRRSSRTYTEGQGCLGKAWETGECHIEQLPDPVTELTAYRREHIRSWNMPRDVVNRLTMLSLSLHGFRIDDDESYEPLAVIVFETVKPRFPNIEALTEFVKQSREMQSLKKFLLEMQPLRPSPTLSRKEEM